MWWSTGDLRRATRWASGLGRLVAIGMIAWGFLAMSAGNLGSGLWLVDETGRSVGDGWISASLLLLVLSLLLGAVGGRKAKLARRLAESQAPDAPAGTDVRALLRNRTALAANVLAAAAALGILVLMVWRPG